MNRQNLGKHNRYGEAKEAKHVPQRTNQYLSHFKSLKGFSKMSESSWVCGGISQNCPFFSFETVKYRERCTLTDAHVTQVKILVNKQSETDRAQFHYVRQNIKRFEILRNVAKTANFAIFWPNSTNVAL